MFVAMLQKRTWNSTSTQDQFCGSVLDGSRIFLIVLASMLHTEEPRWLSFKFGRASGVPEPRTLHP